MTRRLRALTPCLLAALAGCGGAGPLLHHSATTASSTATVPPAAAGIHKIRHVVVIMQENRSFDSYFGTYPGADGIPGLAGHPGPLPCLPDPGSHSCIRPFHDRHDRNLGGPHSQDNARADINAGRMNGFVAQELTGRSGCEQGFNPACGRSSGLPDVMGYHTGADLPNYWAYARHYVLQDHMFQSDATWSLPSHLYMVSGWSAKCFNPDPMSCVNQDQSPGLPPDFQRRLGIGSPTTPQYAWTDLTYLLHRAGISWGYYVFKGNEPDCVVDAAMSCAPVAQRARTPGIWNPLPYFTDVQQDGQIGNVQSLSNFFAAARTGTLPAVSWIDPNGAVSEHPPSLISTGQAYVTGLINAVMQGPDWNSTAIFVSWDDWGGFYDHVAPPQVDQNGYGLRVPGLLISPYAKRGYIDHQTLSFDAYLRFIEDDFLGGQRLDPTTDGRPDPRIDVREQAPQLGDLAGEFDFSQPPRAPELLPLHPHTDLQRTSPDSLLGGFANGPRARALDAAAAYLGIPPLQLLLELRAGLTLRRITRAYGKSLSGLRRRLLTRGIDELRGTGPR